MISSSNPVHSVLCLVLVFCSTSGLFILIEAEFIAMVFIMVYVGAIAVLFLFVVMMLNVRVVQFNVSMLKYLPLGGVIGLIFLLELFLILIHFLKKLFYFNFNSCCLLLLLNFLFKRFHSKKMPGYFCFFIYQINRIVLC